MRTPDIDRNEITEEILEEARGMMDTEFPLTEAVDALFNAMAEKLEEIADELNVDAVELTMELLDEYNELFHISKC